MFAPQAPAAPAPTFAPQAPPFAPRAPAFAPQAPAQPAPTFMPPIQAIPALPMGVGAPAVVRLAAIVPPNNSPTRQRAKLADGEYEELVRRKEQEIGHCFDEANIVAEEAQLAGLAKTKRRLELEYADVVTRETELKSYEAHWAELFDAKYLNKHSSNNGKRPRLTPQQRDERRRAQENEAAAAAAFIAPEAAPEGGQ